ncbi:HET domain-containing protein [Aspergillus tubingensis]|uniref:Heterokaryon incompatibility protein n=1 Tax=Aspergillus niger TaxID=5061 RepID=A0A100IFY0_ASPNG|nr:HET-domain-containing protein [Aspergillus tubingensis]GAQ40529.1 heterokaryon incompatibility protein [Aspergillus niger]GFN12500.1 HET-domain-containing protein [Aspergillus tubingensis]
MLCKICKEGLEGIWDPERTRRLKIDDSDEEYGNGRGSQWEPEIWVFGHHLNRESFVASIEQGCVVCYKFAPLQDMENLDRETLNTQLEGVEYFSVFKILLKPRCVEMTVYYGNISGTCDMIPHEGFDENLSFEIGASTDDQTTWVLIERWLNRCLQGHPTCDDQHEANFIPSRLLELQTDRFDKMFRLVERQHVQPGERYITLSHCWGSTPSNPDLILLEDTFRKLKEYQPLSVLPKTFKHAFIIIERLKVRYIWIDRLCILQDSPEDWQSESATMGQIYKNAFLGISALGSSNDADGCFFSRDSAQVAPSVVNIRVDNWSDPKTFRFRSEKGWAWKVTFDREPLPKRGWTLQERLLCPRVLHFGRKQVFWECRECTCCEIQPNNVYEYDGNRNDKNNDNGDSLDKSSLSSPAAQHNHLWKQLLDAPKVRYIGDPRDQIYVDWCAIAMVFTACQLTVPSDKLVAISGLAKDVRRRLKGLGYDEDDYLAGLWRQNLPGCLTWKVLKPGRRPPSYRAPSWSWASVDGAVQLCYPGTHSVQKKTAQPFALVISAKCIPCGEDETGQVASGSVTSKGPLASATLIPSVKTLPEETAMSVLSLETPGVEGQKPTIKYPRARCEVIFDVKSEMCAEIYCLPIEARHMFRKVWELFGLALIQTKRDTYSRVGYVEMLHESEMAAKNFFSDFPEHTCVLE